MDTLKFEVTIELTNEDIGEATVDSLIQQINEVVAAAVEEKQIEIPQAEIVDYAVSRGSQF